MSDILVTEYRPGRNIIRVGDPVKVRPLHGRSFLGTVRCIRASETTGEVTAIDVFGAPAGRPSAVRTVTPDRITRRAKTRVES